MDVDTPAVVLGAGVNGLGVARSLSRARVPVWLLDCDSHRPEMYTRAAKPLRISALHGEPLVEELVRLAHGPFSRLRPVLFLTREESVRTVSHHRDRLSALYRFSLPPIKLLDTLQHKQGFQCIAEQLGGPIPSLVHIRAFEDLAALESLRYPVVIKPGTRHAGYGRQFKKAYRVEDAAEAVELIRRILPVLADVVAQEWIEGPDANIHFCLQHIDRQGQVTASFTGRKIRSWPPQVGGTASCMPAPQAHEALTGLTTRFFRGAGVIGMAGMEYKRDQRSGLYRMVEPTIGRTDYQAEVAALNGVNLPYAAYCAEIERPWPGPEPAARLVAWHVRSAAAQSAAVQHQARTQDYDGADVVCDALWRCRDPVPFLVQGLQRVWRGLRARCSKLVSGSRVAGSKP